MPVPGAIASNPGPAGGGGGVTLDGAYDFGGAGAGRTITADAGAVVINNAVVDATNTLELTRTLGTGAALDVGGGSMRVFGDGDTVIGAAAMVGTERLRVVGDVLFDGKLTVTGVIDPTAVVLSDPAAGTSLFFESFPGQTAPVSGATTGRIRYNNTTGFWQVSTQGGAYVNIATGTTPVNAFIQDGNSFGAAAVLGTNDAFTLSFETGGTTRATITTTGEFRMVSLGTAALPAYSFTTDTDTGIFSSAANTLNVALAGVEAARFTTGQFLFVDRGTAAAPAYTFTLDADTGMFSSGANNINLTTAGVLRITVDSTNLTTTLAVLHPLGTAALPSMSFTGDTNTGVFSSGADVLDLSAGGTARFQVNTGFLVMNVPLRGAAGTAGAPTYTINGDTDTGMFSSGANVINFATAGVERGRFTATGEFNMVSLGTAALPAYSFTTDPDTGVFSPSANAISLATGGFERFRIDSGGSMLTLQIGSAGIPAWTFIGDANTGIFSSGADTLNFTTAGVERGRFTATGEFLMVSLGTVALPAYSFTGDTNTGMFSTGADVLNFATNGIEAARFTSLGVFRMGAGGSAAAPAISVTGDTNTGISWTAADTLVLSTGGTARITIDSAGKVTIPGVLDPTAVVLSGGTALFFESGDGSTAPLSVVGTGRLRFLAGTGWQASSDGAAYATLATAAGFVQGGNSFGAIATLGTNDAFALSFETTGVSRVTVGAAGNLDIVSGDFQIGSTPVFEADRDFAIDLIPNADDSLQIGSVARRIGGVIISSAVQFLNAVSDANPSATYGGDITMGAGGASAPDLRLSRTGAREWSFDDNAGGAADIDVVPRVDNTNNLGTAAKRWKLIRGVTITSGDLELEDEKSGAAWTIREAKMAGEDIHRLYAIDRVTGKKYRVLMEEVVA
jgi:hypothetical protein